MSASFLKFPEIPSETPTWLVSPRRKKFEHQFQSLHSFLYIRIYVIKKLKSVVAPFLAELYHRSIQNEENIESTYLAEIIPIFKKGLRSIPLNYRLIAKTSVTSKILERIIIERIREHLSTYGFTPDT